MITIDAPPPTATAPKKPKVEAKPAAAVEPVPEAKKFRTNYGGKPAYIGAPVWYCSKDQATGEILTRPGWLFARGFVEPDVWTLSVLFYASARPNGLPDVPFAETPTEGHWCWPVIPSRSAVPARAPASAEPAASTENAAPETVTQPN